MHFMGICLILLCRYQLHSLGQVLEFEKDKDIQEAMIAVSRKLSRDCPTVLIYDEQMPELSVSYILIKRMQDKERQFIVLNLSVVKLSSLEEKYGSNDPAEIIRNFLHILYRRRRCYIFQVWLKDPRILYPEKNTKYHPGWRQSDNVILVANHITRRYNSLINLRFWSRIPNIVGLKRNNKEESNLVRIFTVLPYYMNGKRKSQEIDTWNNINKGFVRNNSRLFFDKFKNFHNASIHLGVLWKEPFFIWGNKENPYLDGLDWRLFLLCQNLLHFSLNFNNINVTGHKINNNTWTGLMGYLADGIIDVGVGGVSVTSERLKYFDFCRTYYTDSFNFIAPHNHVVNTAIGTIFRPLSLMAWLTANLAALCGMITLKFVSYMEHKLSISRGKENNFGDKHFLSFWNIWGFVITIVCQKPYRHLPKALAVQFVYYGLSLTIFCLGMVFSSCLISSILNFKPEPVADKVDDILKTGLPIAIKNYEGHLNDYMMHSGNPMMKKIYETAELVDYYQSFDAMDDVAKGKKIYIDSNAKIHFSGKYRYTGSKGLKFHISSGKIIEFSNIGWPVEKNWPFIKPFDDIISRAVESGLVQHWMEYFMSGKFGGDKEAYKLPPTFELLERKIRAEEVDLSVNLKGGFIPLSRSHVGGVVNLLLIGVLLSVFAFVGECTAGLIGKILRVIRQFYKSFKPDGLAKGLQNKTPKTSNQTNVPKKSRSIGKRKFFNNTKTVNAVNTKSKKKLSAYPQLIWNDFGIQHNPRN